jgi:hypothetical protein
MGASAVGSRYRTTTGEDVAVSKTLLNVINIVTVIAFTGNYE